MPIGIHYHLERSVNVIIVVIVLLQQNFDEHDVRHCYSIFVKTVRKHGTLANEFGGKKKMLDDILYLNNDYVLIFFMEKEMEMAKH
jgi:hypothetical protein